MRGDRESVRSLLQQGADVNAAQGDGMTALHWAASHGDVDLVRMLVYAGARLEAATRNGNYTPLHFAARAGSPAVVKSLLDAGANAKAITTAGSASALHFAAAQGSKDVIALLLDKGVSVDAREGAWGQTPLMWAAAYNRIAAIEILLARGANIAAASMVENIPARERADRAAAQVRSRRAAALRAADQPAAAGGSPQRGGGGARGGGGGGRGGRGEGAGAAGAARDSATVQNAAAPQRGGAAGAQADSAAGRGATTPPAARPPAADSQRTGTSAAAPAAASARPTQADSQRARAEERSLSYGDLVGNKGGLTPLLFAVRQGHTEAVVALLKLGADINEASRGDNTSPLLMATINGHFDLAAMLLQRGANPKQASDAGATPLYAALNVQWSAKSLYPQPTAYKQQKITYLELMEALLKAGADPNVRLKKHLWYMSYNFDLLGVNTTGATPFWRAAYGTDVDAMRLLVKYGADHTVPTQKPAGRQRGDDAPAEEEGGAERRDPSGLPPIPAGGPGVYPIHAASGVGYGEGYAANAHRHVPDGWLPAVKYLVEELKVDINARDHNGYNPVHHAAARGDNQLIEYLVSKGADVTAVSRRGQTTADMANGPVQRVPPFLSTVALLEKLGSKNSNRCRSC
jgi:ankyrin repeat protein